MTSHNKQSRHFVLVGHLKNNKKQINLTEICCEHNDYCNVKKTLDKAHCTKDYSKTCKTAEFYSRYGEDWDQLGVGC